MKNIVIIGLVIILAGAGIYWMMLSPSISQEDFEISATIAEAEDSDNWLLTITLDSNQRLTRSDYSHHIVPFVNSSPHPAWKLAATSENAVTATRDEDAEEKVMTFLEAIGQDSSPAVTASALEVTGLQYSGPDFPVTIELDVPAGSIDWNTTYVIYAHNETRMGRELGWTSLIPVERQ